MPQQQQQQSGQDNSLDFIWMIVLTLGAIFLIWYFGRVYISSAILYARFYELKVIDFIFSLFDSVGIPFAHPDFKLWLEQVHSSIGQEIDFSRLVAFSTQVGRYVRYPLSLAMLGGAVWLYFGGATYNLRHVFDTKLFKDMEQENWPQIVPVVKLDLVNTQLDDGPWAIGLSPIRFCKKYDLLDVTEHNGDYTAKLRRGAAYRTLSLQLGPKWHGIESLPPYLKALFAIFAARLNEDKKYSEMLLDHISASADGEHLDFTGTDELLHKYANTKKVAKIVARHAYITTLFSSLLVGAREAGVLATSEFIWLKPIDRKMWYMLNSVGRPTALAEICGAFSHWLAEKKLGLPLSVPMVDEAVDGLEVALSEVIYKPEEED